MSALVIENEHILSPHLRFVQASAVHCYCDSKDCSSGCSKDTPLDAGVKGIMRCSGEKWSFSSTRASIWIIFDVYIYVLPLWEIDCACFCGCWMKISGCSLAVPIFFTE